MKSSIIDFNKDNLEKWIGDTLYLIEVFSSIIEELKLVVIEINSNHIVFIGEGFKVKFIYDINRYGGRTLNDIEIEKLEEVYRLNTFVLEKESLNLYKKVDVNCRNSVAPLETFRELFYKYLMEIVN